MRYLPKSGMADRPARLFDAWRHRFHSDERPPGGRDNAPNLMANFVAAMGS